MGLRRIKIVRKPAVIITRKAIGSKKLVYFAVANKAHKYRFGYYSRILYIGTTKLGAKRIAASAAARASQLLTNHGVKELAFHIVTCTPQKNVQTWRKLERALLLTFKHEYGSVPLANSMGKNAKWRDEREYFSEKRLRAVLEVFQH